MTESTKQYVTVLYLEQAFQLTQLMLLSSDSYLTLYFSVMEKSLEYMLKFCYLLFFFFFFTFLKSKYLLSSILQSVPRDTDITNWQWRNPDQFVKK